MNTASALVHVYFDVNVVLILGFILWRTADFIAGKAGFASAYGARLTFWRWGLVVALVSPVAAMALASFANEATGSFGARVNLSDFLVAQYLQGSIRIDPFVFESLLGFQAAFFDRVLRPSAMMDRLVLGAFVLFAAFLIVRLGLSILRLRAVLGSSHLWRRSGRVDLRLSDTETVPFSTRGLRRQHIVVPLSMLTRPVDLRMALAHEFQHLRQSDIEWAYAFELLRPLFFWNPAFALWRRRVEELRELTCDHRILARHKIEVGAYIRCLMRVCEDSLGPRRMWAVPMPVVGLVQGRTGLRFSPQGRAFRVRLEALVEARTERRTSTGSMLALLPLPVALFLSAVAIQSSGDWSQDRLMLSTILNLERLESITGTSFGGVGN